MVGGAARCVRRRPSEPRNQSIPQRAPAGISCCQPRLTPAAAAALPSPSPSPRLQDREKKDGGSSDANIYAPFHAHLQYDGVYQSKVADWAGMGHVIPIEGT